MDRMMLVLQPDDEQQQALETLLAEQQDPDSPNYHRWLTPQEFGERFGVSPDDLRQVVDWLESQGFDVEPVEAGGRLVVFSGTASQVESAFRTEIHTYRTAGEIHHANDRSPSIPRALAGVVHGIVSLHDFRKAPQHVSRLASVPEYTSSSTTHYMAPADFATIYDVKALYASAIDGAGQTIAVVGRTNILLSDVRSFRSQFGLPANDPVIVIHGTNPGIVSQGEQGEATLDVEWAGAAAPKATVKLVVSASTSA